MGRSRTASEAPGEGKPEAPAAERKKIDPAAEQWLTLLAESAQRPTRRRVHWLRVLTLRIGTRLEAWAGSRPDDKKAARLMRRWRKQGGRLRRLLRPVREADVFLVRLAELRTELAQPAGEPDGLARLEKMLRSLRRESAGELRAEIGWRQQKLERLGGKAGRALAGAETAAVESAPPLPVEELLAAAAEEFPALDAANLHQFRKRMKAARYLAEQRAAAEPALENEAKQLREMVWAIGEWHDWEQLRLVAARIADRHADAAPLAALLAVKEARSLAAALAACRSGMKKLTAKEDEET
jgi:CHAD domain-containing protein